jgi:hypothetical protein
MRSNDLNSRSEKICSRCQAVFTCGPAQGDEHCWCEHLPHVSLIADKLSDCFCSRCLSEAITNLNAVESGAAVADRKSSLPQLREGEDYYLEGGAMVFTAAYHLRRGYCCESGCRHCPYEQKPVPATENF